MKRTIHPFPARMAPDLAIEELQRLPSDSLVLDPMTGSGTVVRHASLLGHRAVGIDMDPLAVLMSKVCTTKVEDSLISKLAQQAIASANEATDICLPWIDNDAETQQFIDFWFGPKQRDVLRRLAYTLYAPHEEANDPEIKSGIDVLRIALSRIIITKKAGASLGWDISHSRPHKVMSESSFDVMAAFSQSVRIVRTVLKQEQLRGEVTVQRGDARSLSSIKDNSIDAILTSPPYLNAIDYMRGHRLSLVWLGHKLADLRVIRSNSVGAERNPDNKEEAQRFLSIQQAMCNTAELTSKHRSIVARYAQDLNGLLLETHRVLRLHGQSIFVVGNSCLKGTFIQNSEGVKQAAALVGLTLTGFTERELPATSRYLPTSVHKENPLSKRMRTETILKFSKKTS